MKKYFNDKRKITYNDIKETPSKSEQKVKSKFVVEDITDHYLKDKSKFTPLSNSIATKDIQTPDN